MKYATDRETGSLTITNPRIQDVGEYVCEYKGGMNVNEAVRLEADPTVHSDDMTAEETGYRYVAFIIWYHSVSSR